MKAFVVGPDGTADDFDGRRIFFSFQNFKDEVCRKGNCFVCGAARNRTFNDEHVFPNWLLRLCGLQQETLTLPNGNKVKYGTYKIPCCSACNSLLGDICETPISKVISAGFQATVDFVNTGGANALKVWLCLIFLKVHLRDFKNKIALDNRIPGVIGDEYELGELHHVHAIARAATAGIKIDDDVFGTLALFQIEPPPNADFDYCDNLPGRGMLIRIKDLALLHIIDDCDATAGMLSEKMQYLPHPISGIQLREVYAHYLAANIHIKDRPVFRTEFPYPPKISVDLPELGFHPYEPTVFGKLFAGALGTMAENVVVDGKRGKEAIEIIETGNVSFIFDENGKVKSAHLYQT
ncbi:hypothetical protein ELH51_12860 [Rhizobium ruizarguesonis]|uniref:hypothetical protein n=1 Tax=Rhizobium ruizarguesonis TaxID=2081791 RepID=UPI00102FDE01|nr:hypothetical protein [Rhizobium ruizarguesonis]TBB22534.1 hypothetical protein ELH51_12860 [Rhizobium ruizarguesonis]